MASRIEIRRLDRESSEELLATPELFDEPLDTAAARAYVADERNVFLLALQRLRPVGFLRGTELAQLKSTRRQMFLYEIGVVEESRRRGVARELIQTLLRYCRDRGFEEVFVFTSPANEAAVRLYRSTGAVTETEADRMFVYRL